jgi:Ser/Thr protein kinase RdoA (MazF antagonist)
MNQGSAVGRGGEPTTIQGLLDGYRSVRRVAEEDLAMLPLFLLMRGLAEIGWFADRPENATPAQLTAMKDLSSRNAGVSSTGTCPCRSPRRAAEVEHDRSLHELLITNWRGCRV